MSDLASDLRQYVDRASTITLDEVSFARRPRPRRRRTLAIGAVVCCIAVTAIAIGATRNPDRHRVNVADAPSISGTITLEGWHSGPLKPGVALPLGTTAFLNATIRNNSDHS